MARLKCIFACTIILVLASSTLTSQTFEDFKKEIREEYSTFEKETQQKFNNFVAEIDKEFATYLSENFGTYDIGYEKFKPSTPKPDKIPMAEEVEVSGDVIEYEISEVITSYQGPVFPGIKKSSCGLGSLFFSRMKKVVAKKAS